ncbi:MAG: epimerase [Rhodobacteraceae bacterium]|nr:MAG: epimerase [Paracoccaceae bacterium]
MTGQVLILGQSGRFGRNAAQAFARAGWQVRGFDRARDDLMRVAEGVDVILCAWNPPYPDWAAQVPALHAAVRAAALRHDATVIVPGNVYVFGAGTPVPWGPDSPHAARNPLGLIRVRMEAAYRDEGVRTILLRGGDFLDTGATGNWFDRMMVPKLPKGRFVYPGDPDIPHAWAWLPDMTRAAADLAGLRADLPRFADIPFPGYTLTGRQIRDILARITGRDLRLKRLNWLPLRLAAPVWPMGRCLLEMRYLWDTPHSLDDAPLRRLLPGFTPTDPDDAFRAAIAHLGF